MNNQHIYLDKAWNMVSMKLSFDVEDLSSEFIRAIDKDANTISLSEFNDVLSLFCAMEKNHEVSKLIDTYIDKNIFNKNLYYQEFNTAVNWNEQLFFNVSTLRRLNKKPVIKVMKTIILSHHLINHKDKGYLRERSEEDWVELISEAEGNLLKRAIDMIGHFDFVNGNSAIGKIKEKSALSKIAIEILQKH